MKLISIFTLFLLFVGLANAQTEVGVQKKDYLKCKPKEVSKGEDIFLSMELPHGGDFAIKDPAGNYFTIVHRRASASVKDKLLMSAEEFQELRVLRLNSGKIKGIPYRVNAHEPELIFTLTGNYELIVTDTLYSDSWPTSSSCVVSFRSK